MSGDGEKATELVAVVVETPRGSRNKYKLDEESGRMKLAKVLPEGMVFPFDFGSVPGTLAEDGDPLDVLVLCDEPTFPGCEVPCRIVGVLKALQRGPQQAERRNDRIIAVADCSVLFAGVHELAELQEQVVSQVEAFFVNYHAVRHVRVQPLGRGDAAEALELLRQARRSAAA